LEIKNYEDKLVGYDNDSVMHNNYNKITFEEIYKIIIEKEYTPLSEVACPSIPTCQVNAEGEEILEGNEDIEKCSDEWTELFKLVSIFTPSELRNKTLHTDYYTMNILSHIRQFKYRGNEILLYFCRFLLDKSNKNQHILKHNNYKSNYKYITLFKMVETLL
jgi:hypothetical protein